MAEALTSRVIVVQMGARRSYELARMLESRGALAALYTDAAWPEHQRSLTKSVIALLSPHARSASARRTVKDIPADKIRSTFAPNIVGALSNAAGLGNVRRYRLEDSALGAAARRWGIADANIVLNTIGNGGFAFLKRA